LCAAVQVLQLNRQQGPLLAERGASTLQPTAAALTVPSAGIRCLDPGATVRPAQDADLPAEHHVAHQGGGGVAADALLGAPGLPRPA
jgi:hypothetical protein